MLVLVSQKALLLFEGLVSTTSFLIPETPDISVGQGVVC
jgi:hypothetical protein